MASRLCSLGLPLCLLLVAACDRERDGRVPLPPKAAPQASSSGEAAAGGGVRLALLQPSPDTDMAALEGFLHAEGPCLYIVGNDRTRSRTLPAFSFSDISWDDATGALRARGADFADGQRVLLTGGTPPQSDRLRWVQPPDPSCDASDLFVVGAIDRVRDEPAP